MDKINFVGLRIALYVGGLVARGAIDSKEADNFIREKMEEEGVQEDAFEEINIFVYALVSFADSVRAAERRNLPIAKFFGEKFPE